MLEHLTRSCPNLLHLSLCKYFGDENGDSSLVQTVQTQIEFPVLRVNLLLAYSMFTVSHVMFENLIKNYNILKYKTVE